MYGLEAISAANGWAQAATGATIVMLGLAALALVISRIGFIIDLMENTTSKKVAEHIPAQDEQPEKILPQLPEKPLENISEALDYYKIASADLGEKFALVDFHKALVRAADPHPHLTIRTLREKGYLEAIGQGLFRWQEP